MPPLRFVMSNNGSMAIVSVQSFDAQQIEIMRKTIAKDIPTADFLFFLEVCKYRGLNPFNREVYAIPREGRMTIQIGIDGLRKLAERSGKYKGQKGPYYCGADGVWREEWLEDSPPVAAKVGILRADFDEPVWAVARYSAYVQRKKDGSPTDMWRKFFDVLLAKCAESLAIRKAFPAECGGIHSDEEMMQAEVAGAVVESVSPISARLNALYEQGKNKGEWTSQAGLYAFASAELGFALNRESIYQLDEAQLAQLERALEEEQAA